VSFKETKHFECAIFTKQNNRISFGLSRH
jgi:hypothetical protein